MNIKVKKKIQDKIVKCFRELKDIKGIYMTDFTPMCHIESNNCYELGTPFPKVIQKFTIDFKLIIDEDCIEVDYDD